MKRTPYWCVGAHLNFAAIVHIGPAVNQRASQKMLNVDNKTLLDIYGNKGIELSGNISINDLAQMMVENWIPYLECHKCGRSDYCKFAQPHPVNPLKKLEIRCGVAEAVIRNFLKQTESIAQGLEPNALQAYLDGAYYLTKFTQEAEQRIGMVMNPDVLDWWGAYAPRLFGNLTEIRDTLNSVAQNLKGVPELSSERSLFLVEGWAEKAFLDKLRESHSTWFSDLMVECYDGSGNRRSKRIAMLLGKYIDLGYTIFIQGDADGKPEEIFKGLVDAGKLKRENTFIFAHDFETSIPLDIFIEIIDRIGVQINFDRDLLKKSLAEKPRSIIRVLQENFGVDLNAKKMGIAVALGEFLNDHQWAWWQDDDFMNTELGQFLRFIQNMG
ncbi:hypothetical protein ACVCL3_01610 [Rhodanobacter sp. UC4437_H4]